MMEKKSACLVNSRNLDLATASKVSVVNHSNLAWRSAADGRE